MSASYSNLHSQPRKRAAHQHRMSRRVTQPLTGNTRPDQPAKQPASSQMALLMLLIAVVQRFILTPQMVFLGRLIDWIPVDQPAPERVRFWMLHNAYVGLEMLNWALGLS